MKTLGTVSRTVRGFSLVNFRDQYQSECSVQCSSAIGDDNLGHPGSSFLWIGVDDPDPKIMASDAPFYGVKTEKTTGWVEYLIPEAVLLTTRMHLDREQVKGLIERLQYWLKNGEL